MADEFTIDAKYKRDNLVAEHERYRKALQDIVRADPEVASTRSLMRRAEMALNAGASSER